jgi:uncharacterized protein YdhG (YjbR/CyaY superfamily)
MGAAEIDDYLADVPEPGRGTLEALRRSILSVVPDAEQCISYGLPAFKVDGSVVAVAGYDSTRGSLHFPADRPLPDDLVRTLVEARLRQIASTWCPTDGSPDAVRATR